MRKPAKALKEVPAPVSKPANWHKSVAGVAGEISLAVVRRSMTKGDVQRWATTLEGVVGEMRDLTS